MEEAAEWSCKLLSTSAEGFESRTRNAGTTLAKCFNELEVIFQCIFSWHQRALHNGYYITAPQLRRLGGAFCLFLLPLSLFPFPKLSP